MDCQGKSTKNGELVLSLPQSGIFASLRFGLFGVVEGEQFIDWKGRLAY